MDGIDKMMTIEHLYYNWGLTTNGESFPLHYVRLVFRLSETQTLSDDSHIHRVFRYIIV